MTVEIQGKKVGIKFNNYGIEQLPKVKYSTGGYYAFLTTLIWCGYLGWCYAKQLDEEIDFEAVSDWVDSSINNEAIAEEIKAIYELYTQSEAYKKMQKKSLQNGQLQPEESLNLP